MATLTKVTLPAPRGQASVEDTTETQQSPLYINNRQHLRRSRLVQLELVMRHVKESGSSVEILLSFSAPMFVRWGWQVLKKDLNQQEIAEAELNELDRGEYDAETPNH